jgi:hypothetical protein
LTCRFDNSYHRAEIPSPKHLIHNLPHMVQVLIRNLHKHAARLMQQLLRQQQPVAQIGQVGVNTQLPGIPERLDHLRFLGEVGVGPVLDVALVGEGLEVGAVFDTVGRVDVDHLHRTGHALLLQKRVHHQQGVAGNQAVHPAPVVAVELHRLPGRQRLLEPGAEEVALAGAGLRLAVLHAFAQRRQEGHGVDAFVHVQADGIHLEVQPLGLAAPVEVGALPAFEFFQGGALDVGVSAGECFVDESFDGRPSGVELQGRVQVGVVGPAGLAGFRVGVGRDHAHFRVVLAPVVMAVGEDLLAFSRCRAGRLPGFGCAGRRLGCAGLGGLDHRMGQVEGFRRAIQAMHRTSSAFALAQFAFCDEGFPQFVEQSGIGGLSGGPRGFEKLLAQGAVADAGAIGRHQAEQQVGEAFGKVLGRWGIHSCLPRAGHGRLSPRIVQRRGWAVTPAASMAVFGGPACREPGQEQGQQKGQQKTRDAGKHAGFEWFVLLGAWNLWWRGGGSNSRPPHCERGALPAELPPHEEPRI